MLSTALKAVLHLKSAEAARIRDNQIAEATAAIAADPRVVHVQYLGRVLQGRPAYEIKATDTAEGTLNGDYSIGAVLNAMAMTTAEHEAHLAEGRAKFDALVESVRMQAIERRKQDEKLKAERVENLRRLKSAGISRQRLSWICNRLASGSYVPNDALEDWAWYESEIVRGRPSPMKISLYVDGFVD
ncbi:hypothetical protein AO398_00435 [Methylobacterium sp. GXS13]|uniref:hypothetical protein n=1 Tax=Methylobacterium sp. GXS13 TaxID=1730094 RepID=UPI00071B89E1|nr:hypothetical protein [Methylobacterium sp. GXS13]KST61192.1 hypothetical protein AO398_00435 [Methylobacterium sp. GXS13]